jgi:hypothetical protein
MNYNNGQYGQPQGYSQEQDDEEQDNQEQDNQEQYNQEQYNQEQYELQQYELQLQQQEDDTRQMYEYYEQQYEQEQHDNPQPQPNETFDISDIMAAGITRQTLNDPRKKNLKTFLESLFEKFNTWIGRNQSEITQPLVPIESLITVVLSSHSATSAQTYLENYAILNTQFKTNFANYDDGIYTIHDKLLDKNKHRLITAVSQGICSYADYKKNKENEFTNKYTRDASNIKYIYDKSLDLSTSMKIKGDNNNRTTVEKYILNIGDPLNKADMLRYTDGIIEEYGEKITRILEYMVYLIQLLDDIQTAPKDPQIDGAKNLIITTIQPYFNYLLTQLNLIKKMDIANKITKFQGIIAQPIYPIKWGNPQTNANVNKDIFNIVILRNIIDTVILINPIITSLLDSDQTKKNINIMRVFFSDRIYLAVNNDIPLCFGEGNDKMIFNDGILQNSFWRSEEHTLNYNDTEVQFAPNKGEKDSDFDCNYGLNIFALMLNLNSPVPDYFLPKSDIQTRLKNKNKDPGWSGNNTYDSFLWRTLRLNTDLEILNKIVNIFKQNFLKSIEDYISPLEKQQTITSDERQQIKLFRFITYSLKQKKNDIQTILGLFPLDDYYGYEIGFTKDNLKILKYITQLQNIPKTDPSVFAYCRVLEFTYLLEKILIHKEVLLSELLYLFQYLLNFDYVIYILTSCRICEDFTVRTNANRSKKTENNKNTKGDRSSYNTRKNNAEKGKENVVKVAKKGLLNSSSEQGESSIPKKEKVTVSKNTQPNVLRPSVTRPNKLSLSQFEGGNKTKRRKCNKRKTYKRRRINKRKTYKRRRINKRKTYKRK